MAAKTTNSTSFTVDTATKKVTGGNGVDTLDATGNTIGGKAITSDGWTFAAGNGDDTVIGSSYADIIWGDSLGNSTTTDNGADKLYGADGNDQIHGGNGADLLEGDKGADQLWGDKGGDTFKYKLISDSSATAGGAFDSAKGDVINDFKASEGDKLDLSAVPLTGAGAPDELTWGGPNEAYGVWTAGGIVYADTNGDGVADMAIKVTGTVGPGDFLGVNHDPAVAAALTASTAEDAAAITRNLLAGASDSDGDTLSVTNVTYTTTIDGNAASTPAGLSTGGTGNATLTVDTTNDAFDSLAQGETMKIVVGYDIVDGHGGSVHQTETVTITGVNDGPALTGTQTALANGTEDQDYPVSTTDLLAGFGDIDHGDTIHVENLSVDQGSIASDGLGGYVITLPGDYHGPVTISYDVVDSHGASLAATLDLTVDNVDDEATGDLAVAGTAEEGGQLVASLTNVVDVDGSTTTAYQWQSYDGSNWNDIGGQNTDTLNIASDQSMVGETVRVVATTTDVLGGTTEFTGDAMTIANVDDEATGTLGVTGTAEEGGQLVAALTGVSDDDGATTTAYQWQSYDGSNWNDIGGQNTDTLNIASDQSMVGETVRVVATTTDVLGGTTEFTGDAMTIANVDDEATGTLGVTGTAEEGGQLVAALTGVSDDDGSTTTAYQWQSFDGSNWNDIGGQNTDTLNIASDQSMVGETVRAVATTTDVLGGTTTFEGSGQTIANVNDVPVISGTNSGLVVEDSGSYLIGGDLLANDPDPGQYDVWSTTATLDTVLSSSAAAHGTFAVDAAGVWSYTLNNNNSEVSALNNGGTLTDAFTLTTADGTHATVTVTIQGHTDGITLAAVVTSGDPNNNDGSGIAGPNTIGANGSATTEYGGTGNDTINGGNGNDILYGGSGVDSVQGQNDNDTLYGGDGNDILSGGNNDDTIIGGYGADSDTGNGGADLFRFLSANDRGDTITDFNRAEGDKIDLAGIDADISTPLVNDGFAFGGTSATNHGVWYAYDAGLNVTHVYADTDGDTSTAEFWIDLNGSIALLATDFNTL